jgi:hypothetical protein
MALFGLALGIAIGVVLAPTILPSTTLRPFEQGYRIGFWDGIEYYNRPEPDQKIALGKKMFWKFTSERPHPIWEMNQQVPILKTRAQQIVEEGGPKLQLDRDRLFGECARLCESQY